MVSSKFEEQKHKNIKNKWINIRVTSEEKSRIDKKSKNAGLDSISAYILQIIRKK